MRREQVFQLPFLGAAAIFLTCQPEIIAGEHPRQGTEVELQAATFPDVVKQLFGTSGMPGLLNGNQPFEFRARNTTLTPEQAQNFFAPASPTGMDLAALVAAVQRLPGSEVKITGLVDGSPFQLKVEAGEVKLRGLVLPQAQLNSLLDRLQAIQGLREAKIQTLVNGQPVVFRVENERREIEAKARDGIRAERVRREDRAMERHGHHAETRPEPARVEPAARVEIERAARPERLERIERVHRPGRH